MNTLIMITLALMTICCFANGEVADDNVIAEMKKIKSSTEESINELKAEYIKWNETLQNDLIEAKKDRHDFFDGIVQAAITSLSEYDNAARANGKKVKRNCQILANIRFSNVSVAVHKFDSCIKKESQIFHDTDDVLTTGQRFLVQLDMVIEGTMSFAEKDGAATQFNQFREAVGTEKSAIYAKYEAALKKITICQENGEKDVRELITFAETDGKRCIDTGKLSGETNGPQ